MPAEKPNPYENVSPYLDYLYNSNVRCPYCKARIFKYTTVCQRCGLHKKQIAEASNKEAKKIMKEKTGQLVFKTRKRPLDISFTGMMVLLVFGMFGAHCFAVGRKIRGIIIVSTIWIGILGFFVFPESVRETYREAMESVEFPWPTDVLIVIGAGMWAFDVFAVVFGLFKYPIRLGEAPTVEKKRKK